MPIIIRNANIADTKEVIPLIYQAYKTYAYRVCGSKDLPTILERLEFFFTHPKVTLVHYSHFLVLEDTSNTKVVGTASCLRGDFIPIYFTNLAELLAIKANNPQDPDVLESIREFVKTRTAIEQELHVDVLAVDEAYRKQGLAERLLDKSMEIAKENEMKKMTLLALESIKPFYESKGFSVQKEIEDYGAYYIMEKLLP